MEHATSYAFVQKYFPKTTEIAVSCKENINNENSFGAYQAPVEDFSVFCLTFRH